MIESAELKSTALIDALTPSGATKGAYIGEFKFKSASGRVEYTVPWTTIKEIMAAIRRQAGLE